MSSAIKYMVNEKGQKTSVLVPLKTWAKINDDYKKLQNKFKVFIGLKSAFEEVRKSKVAGKQLQTLKDHISASKR